MERDLRSETIPASQHAPQKFTERSSSQIHSQQSSNVDTPANVAVGLGEQEHQSTSAAIESATTETASHNVSSDAPSAQPQYARPQTLIGSLGLLLGFRADVALVMPALCGGVLGWWTGGILDLPGLALTLISYFCLIAGFIVLSEYSDYRFCRRPASKYSDSGDQLPDANLILSGYFQTEFVVSTAALLLLISLLSNLILAVTIASWPVLFFFFISAVLIGMYLVPPPLHRYLAWGVGELGILIGIGIIPLASSYYVQRGLVESLPLLVGIPLGAFAVLVLFSRSLIYQRRDWMLRKRTLAVVLGEQRSSSFLIASIVAAYASLLLIISITPLPLLLMFGLTTLPIALRQFKQGADAVQTTFDRYDLHQLLIKAMLYTTLLLVGLLLAEKLW